MQYAFAPLSREQQKKIGVIKALLDEVCPRSLVQWTSECRTWSDVDIGLDAWMNVGVAYRHYGNGKDLSPAEKRIVFNVFKIFSRMRDSREGIYTVLEHTLIKVPLGEITNMAELFYNLRLA